MELVLRLVLLPMKMTMLISVNGIYNLRGRDNNDSYIYLYRVFPNQTKIGRMSAHTDAVNGRKGS